MRYKILRLTSAHPKYHVLSILVVLSVIGLAGAGSYFKLPWAFLGLGCLCNFVALEANGLKMPYSADQPVSDGDTVHIRFNEHTRVRWLCDWIGGNTSPGDVLIFVGLAMQMWYWVVTLLS